jgi:hypothetical protein
VAERDAAIHAARRLVAQVALVHRQRELAEMAHAVAGELILLLLPVVFEEPCDLTHLHSFSGMAELDPAILFQLVMVGLDPTISGRRGRWRRHSRHEVLGSTLRFARG